MASIGKVAAVFTASTSGLTSGVRAAEGAFRGMRGSTDGLQSSVAGLGTKLNVLIGIDVAKVFVSMASYAASAASSLVRLGAAEADTIDRTSKLAARLGMTYGELAGLSYAGDLAGVSLDQIGAAATKADVAFVKASQGSATAQAAFAGLGLSVEQLGGLSAAGRFDAIAQSIAALPTEAQRAAAAVQIFGRAGAELLPLFNSGAEAIAKAREESERFGLTLSDAQGQDVEAMNDAFTRAQSAIAGVIQQVVAYLSPAIQQVTDTFSNLIGSVGGANIGQAIGQALLQGAEYLAGVADYLIANLPGIFSYFSSIGQQWNAVFDFGYRVGQAFLGVFKIFEFVGNTIGGAISDIVSMLLGAAADTAGLIPGFGDVAAGLRGAADYMGAQADNYLAAANNSLTASGEAFSNAFASAAPDAGQAIAGPLVTSLRAATAQAEASADSISEAAKPEPIKVEQTVQVSEAVKGIDSRSSAGVSEMFRLMRGDGSDIQERQLSALEQIAENTAGDEGLLAYGLE